MWASLELFGLVLGLFYEDVGRFFKPTSGNTGAHEQSDILLLNNAEKTDH